MRHLTAMAAAALLAALAACSKEQTPNPAPEGEIGLTVLTAPHDASADAASRTVLENDTRVLWIDKKEQLKMLETAAGKTIHKTSGFGTTADNGLTMSFQIWLDKRTDAGPYRYHAVYPHTACTASTDPAAYPVTTPAAQTPAAASFDPVSDLLVARPFEMERQATSNDKLTMRFRRIIAVGKMTIKGVQSADPVRTVRFTAPGKAVAGVSTLDLDRGTVARYGSSAVAETLTLDYTALAPRADGSLPVYFTCLPFELSAGDTFVVTVSTATQEFAKTVTIPAGRPIAFRAGELSSFSVNMAGVAASAKADAVALEGSALPAGGTHALKRTQENDALFANLVTLSAGTVRIPARFGDETRYLRPAAGASEMDGEAVAVEESTAPYDWTIPSDGEYRIAVDTDPQRRSVAIYSPAKALKPLAVTFRPNGDAKLAETTIEVTDLYLYGDPTWDGTKLNCTPSLADPQVLVYSGTVKFRDRCSFRVSQGFKVNGIDYKISNTYAFTCPLKDDGTKQDISLVPDIANKLHGGSDGPTRNSYYKFSEGTYFVVFDLRNKTITASKR